MNWIENFSPRPALAYVLLTLAAFIWAVNTVISRAFYETIPPFGMNFWRVLVAVLVLLPIALPELRRAWPVLRRHLKMLVFLGFLMTGAQAMIIVAVNFTTAINATVANATQPAITAIMAAILVGTRIRGLQGAGIVAALAGIAVMVVRADLSVLQALAFNPGDFIALIAVVGWASYAIYFPRLPHDLGLSAMLFLIMASGLVVMLPTFLLETAFHRTTPASAETFWVSVVLGLCSVVSVYVWNAGLRAVGAIHATMFINLIPIFGAAVAITFLGEQLFLFHVIGAALVCIGISTVVLTGRRKEES